MSLGTQKDLYEKTSKVMEQKLAAKGEFIEC